MDIDKPRIIEMTRGSGLLSRFFEMREELDFRPGRLFARRHLEEETDPILSAINQVVAEELVVPFAKLKPHFGEFRTSKRKFLFVSVCLSTSRSFEHAKILALYRKHPLTAIH